MKKIVFTFLIAALVSIVCYAQVPSTFNYQAVIRNIDGSVRSNEDIEVGIAIMRDGGSQVYSETHSETTNQFGLITLQVGSVSPTAFNSIDWSQGGYSLLVSIDGTSLTPSLIKTVPYALHAKTSDETDPIFASSQANNITSQHITDLGNLSNVNTGDQDLSGYATKDMENVNITNLADPVSAQDAATKAYVDVLETLIEELQIAVGIKLEDSDGNIYIKDIDGNIYRTVVIGDQRWMAENLKVINETNGAAIPLVTDNTVWGDLGSNDKAYCYYNNNANGEKDTYGVLYTNAAAQNVCPIGWHLPSSSEGSVLVDYINSDGHSGVEGTALKSTSGWSDGNGTDDYGFTGLPCGYRNNNNGAFSDKDVKGIWWSSDASIPGAFLNMILDKNSTEVSGTSSTANNGHSIRCIQD